MLENKVLQESCREIDQAAYEFRKQRSQVKLLSSTSCCFPEAKVVGRTRGEGEEEEGRALGRDPWSRVETRERPLQVAVVALARAGKRSDKIAGA